MNTCIAYTNIRKKHILDYLFEYCADTGTMYTLNVLNNIFNLSFMTGQTWEKQHKFTLN